MHVDIFALNRDSGKKILKASPKNVSTKILGLGFGSMED